MKQATARGDATSQPPSSFPKQSSAGWMGSPQALRSLAGNADVSLACSGADTAPSVQPQCSPFLARFQGLQSEKVLLHLWGQCKASWVIVPCRPGQAEEAAPWKMPYRQRWSALAFQCGERGLGFNHNWTKFLSWFPFEYAPLRPWFLRLNMQKDNKELKIDTYLSPLWTWEIKIATNASQPSGVRGVNGARLGGYDLFCVLSEALHRL